MASMMSSVSQTAKSVMSSMSSALTGKISKGFAKDDLIVVFQPEYPYISHLIAYLLHNEVKVRVVARRQETADSLRQAFSDVAYAHERLEVIICTDCGDSAACDTALHGATYLFLPVASFPGSYHGNAEKDMVDPTLASVPCLLESAKRAATVKVCLLGAMSALGDITKTGQTFTADSHFIISREDVCKMTDKAEVFAACNALGEKAAWDWYRVAGDKHPFPMTSLLHAHPVGPELLTANARGPNRIIVDVLSGHHDKDHPRLLHTGFIEGRDIARAAVDCLHDHDTDGKRYVLDAGTHSFQEMAEWAKSVEGFEVKASPEELAARPQPQEQPNKYDAALTAWKVEYTPVKQSVKEMLQQHVLYHQHQRQEQQHQESSTAAATAAAAESGPGAHTAGSKESHHTGHGTAQATH